ncbi:hypothetical protein ANAPC1_00322 [Anaplasma phagocytophilum]|uniref:Uncharacterized protein n=1 Tax=Anaplasma phagocytophilum TaxID=948 RepID=A0AA45USJ0_ANAPH|nr:hypothetical protein ANAPC1_00322 [Anaplasma phagocytophilum]
MGWMRIFSIFVQHCCEKSSYTKLGTHMPFFPAYSPSILLKLHLLHRMMSLATLRPIRRSSTFLCLLIKKCAET